MRLLDTDVLIDLLRGVPQASTWLASLAEAPGLPGYVALELLQGCRNLQEARRIERLTAVFIIYWPTVTDSNRALSAFAPLRLASGVGLLDILIAECAIGLNATLCTFNVRHFQGIAALVTEQPYTRP